METTHPDVEAYYPKVLDFIQGHNHLCISTIQRAVTHGFKLTCAIVDRLISEGHLRVNPNGGYDVVKSTATTPKTTSPIDAAIQLKDDELRFSEDGTVLLRVPNDATEVTIPEGVTMIGDEAFLGCTQLTYLLIPEGVKRIGDSAFSGCTGLTSLWIPEGVKRIGGFAFWKCENLTKIRLPQTLTTIGPRAFLDCRSLTSMIIPDSVTEIGDGAFWGCSHLTKLTLPSPNIIFGTAVFRGCQQLKEVLIFKDPDHWGPIGGTSDRREDDEYESRIEQLMKCLDLPNF